LYLYCLISSGIGLFFGLTGFIWATKALAGAAINAEVPSY
jgi:hypothetical protein